MLCYAPAQLHAPPGAEGTVHVRQVCGDFCNGASVRVRLCGRRDGHGIDALLSCALVLVERDVWQRRRARLPEPTARWLGLCCCCMTGRHLARPELFGLLLARLVDVPADEAGDHTRVVRSS